MRAKVRVARGEHGEARKMYRAGVQTWRELPEHLQWKHAKAFAAALWGLWFG